MVEINPIIVETINEMMDDGLIPKNAVPLIIDLLRLELQTGSDLSGIKKVYSQIIDKYTNDKEVVKWCETND